MRIKLYDERDYDYYNPKPYILRLVSMLDEDDLKRVRGWIDSDLRYIFKDEDSHELKDNFVNEVKLEHTDRLVRELQNGLHRKANEIDERLRSYQKEIEEIDERIANQSRLRQEYVNRLARLKDVIAKATRTNN
jgi:vacuolar-type H+-ATPase subunit I/STV1